MSKSLPDNLKNALLTLLNSVPRQDLIRASEELTLRYRSSERDKKPVFMTTEAHRMAYLAVRMPATFAAVSCVLKAVERRMPDFSPKSLCDLGAGPGTASWAAVEAFSDIADITLCKMPLILP
jgi:ribosomal protein RSM22 (predicted rRNA methylase)